MLILLALVSAAPSKLAASEVIEVNQDTLVSSTFDTLTISGTGTIYSGEPGTIAANVVKVTGGSILAKGLTIKTEVAISPKATLGSADGDKITLEKDVVLTFTATMEGTNGTFGSLNLGAIGSSYTILPKKIDIDFLPTSDLADTFDAVIVRGTNLTNCQDWIDKVNFVYQSDVDLVARCSVAEQETKLSVGRPQAPKPKDSTVLVLGVVIGVLVFVVIVVVLIAVCKKKRKEKKQEKEKEKNDKKRKREKASEKGSHRKRQRTDSDF